MRAEDLRRPLSELEREALEKSCKASGVDVVINDPIAIAKVAAILRAGRSHA